MNKVEGAKFNDLQEGREYDCRHGVDDQWASPQFHMHPHYEFYLFIRGNAQIVIEDERFDAHPMDLFVFPPGVMHRAAILGHEEPYERAYFYATRKALAEMEEDGYPLLPILEEAARGGIYSFHAEDTDASRFIRLVDHYIEALKDPDPSVPAMNRCRVNMQALIACKTAQHKNILTPRPSDRISEVIRYINEHMLEPLTLDSLAEQFYVSKYTLLHDFKDYANISVHQYILTKRVIFAQQLMQRGCGPGNAAKQSGFNDYAGFYRAFVRQARETPQAYFDRSRRMGSPAAQKTR